MLLSFVFNIIVIVFVLATLVQLFYWGYCFALLGRYTHKEQPQEQVCEPVSVIICAYNEADNLSKNLIYFLEQDYPAFELIVVNDGSTDKTEEIILNFQKKFPNLRLLSTGGNTTPGKKAALNLGIQQASFERLFLSDADCRPASPQWLRLMNQSFSSGISIVLGYGPYHKTNGFLNKFIRFETFYTAIQYLSFSLAGHPYMGVGRNLAYERKVFEQVKGFSTHEHLMSGDDDLLVNQAARADNTTINLFKGTRVYSMPVSSWGSYYIQKRRHLSVGTHYKLKHQLALGALALSHFAFYAGLAVLFVWAPEWWHYLTLIYLVRMGVVFHTSAGASTHLGERDLLSYLPLLDVLFLVYYFMFVPILLTGSRIQKWK